MVCGRVTNLFRGHSTRCQKRVDLGKITAGTSRKVLLRSLGQGLCYLRGSHGSFCRHGGR